MKYKGRAVFPLDRAVGILPVLALRGSFSDIQPAGMLSKLLTFSVDIRGVFHYFFKGKFNVIFAQQGVVRQIILLCSVFTPKLI